MLDTVLDFAELREFVDLKIKNYSSGMMVRLAFSIMIQADADTMLIDEVLAVGDASFGQKCMEVFYERRRRGKTIVLVTHDMATVQSMCHRAMVVHEGRVQYVGDPEDASLRYYRLNFAGPPAPDSEGVNPPGDYVGTVDLNARLVSARLMDENGDSVENVEQGKPISIDVVVEIAREMANPTFSFHVLNADGMIVSEFSRVFDRQLLPRQRVRLCGRIENPFVPGRYSLDCWIGRKIQARDLSLQPLRLLHFHVFGTAPRHGVVSLQSDIEPTLEP